MRLAMHTVICCCVFAIVLPLVKGAKGELNTSMKKRFRLWLQSRMKRDLRSSAVAAAEGCSDASDGSQQGGNAKMPSPPSSFGLRIRPRRSLSAKSSGCVLVTCAYHDLLHRLHQITDRQKEANAPEKKISSKGYGRRRRRSLQDVVQAGRQGWSTEAASTVSLASETDGSP